MKAPSCSIPSQCQALPSHQSLNQTATIWRKKPYWLKIFFVISCFFKKMFHIMKNTFKTVVSFFCLHIWKFFYKGDGCPIFFFDMVTRWLGVFWCLMWLFCKENGGNRKASFGITVTSRILIYFLKREKVQSSSKI